MVAFWDIIGMAANLFQLFGVDAITLIAIGASFLEFHEMNKECRKLQGRVHMLRGLLMSSVGGRWIMQQQQQQNDHSELVAGQLQVASVLREAQDLVESYKRSSLYARVRGERGMATRFRDLRSRVDSCCHLILAVNAFLLVVQPPNQNHHHPPSLVRTTDEGNDDDVGVPPSPGDSVHAAEPSSTAAPDDTHVIDIVLLQPAWNHD